MSNDNLHAQIKFTLGQTAKDKVTGFQGVMTGFCRYLTGCDQYLLAPKVDVDGKHVDAKWYDVNRLELVEGKETVEIDSSKDNGPCEQAPIK